MRFVRIALRNALFVAVLAVPTVVTAQQAEKLRRVGVLNDGTRREAVENRVRNALRQWGYAEGQNLVLHFAWADERPERLPGLTAELVRSNVEVILATSTQSVVAAKRITATVPIVTMSGDPVGAGLAASLARPGGNVTGVFLPFADLAAKRLQLLKEIVPGLESVVMVFNPGNPASVTQLRGAEAAARALGITAHPLELRTQADIESVVDATVARKVGGVIVIQDPVTFRAAVKLAQMLARHRLPASHAYSEFVDAGGLVSYGVSLSSVYGLAAGYIDRLLKGAKAAELPMEQPTKFELVINLKTAKALGLTVPSSLLLRADRTVD
jgi:putative ABC transport system substrate-binding protein